MPIRLDGSTGITVGTAVTIGTSDIKVGNNVDIDTTSIVGVTTIGVTTAYVTSINDGPISGMKNRIINGDSRIDQRNVGAAVTLTTSGPYPVDTWFAQAWSGVSVSGQQVTDAPSGFTNSTKFTVTSANTDNNYQVNYTHRIEGFNMPGLGIIESGGATLSFWIKSSETGTYTLTISTGFRAGSVYNFGFCVVSYTVNSANTWEYKTISIPTYGSGSAAWQTNNAVGLEVTFNVAVGSSFSGVRSDSLYSWQTISSSGYFSGSTVANNTTWGKTLSNTWQVTGVQLEKGPIATPFERRSYGQELALCQRYYEKSYNADAVPGAVTYGGMEIINIDDNAQQNQGVRYKVSKRSGTQTVTLYNPDTGSTSTPIRTNTGNDYAATANFPGDNGFFIDFTPSVGNFARFHWTCSSAL